MDTFTYAVNGQYADKHLECIDCKIAFVFEVGEQQFFEKKGLKDPPKRCKPCRKLRRDERDARMDRGDHNRGNVDSNEGRPHRKNTGRRS